MAKRKSSLGRQKITLQKISKKNHLQVTFSKRRAGLFKKASELCTLCGVEVAIVVFSPADKAFTFGDPNVDSILDKFLANNPTSTTTSTMHPLIEAHRKANVHELNGQLSHVVGQLELEKKRGEVLGQMRKASQSSCWWERPVDELGVDQLEHLKSALEELQKNVAKQAASQVLLESMNSTPPFFGVDNSNGFRHDNNFDFGHGNF